MLPYEVVGCFDEDDSGLLEPLIASYLVRIPFPCPIPIPVFVTKTTIYYK